MALDLRLDDMQQDDDTWDDDQPALPPNLYVSESRFNFDNFRRHKPVHQQLQPGLIIEKRYKLLEHISSGSFGAAYRAKDLLIAGQQVVLKARVSSLTDDDDGLHGAPRFSDNLQRELDIYMQLGAVAAADGPPPGIPEVFSAGVHKLLPSSRDEHPVYVSYIAMQSLGPSLWRLCHPRPDTQADATAAAAPTLPLTDEQHRLWVAHAGKGMLQALASMHAMGYMHRDVKTENFCVERGCCRSQADHQIYVIDFGFARRAFGYYALDTYGRPHASFWGTPNYGSLQSLQRFPQTPRDDLEALVFCLLELELRPHHFLPWNNTLTTNSEAAAGWSDEQLLAMQRKKRAAWDKACSQGLVPRYLRRYHAYISSLQAWHVVDYEWLLACLDSRATGQPPAWQPHPTMYRHWPDDSQPCDESTATDGVLLQARLAAAAIVGDEQLVAQLQEQQEEQEERWQRQVAAYVQPTESDDECQMWPGEDESEEFNSMAGDPDPAAAGCGDSAAQQDAGAGSGEAAVGCSPSLCGWAAWGVCAHLSQPDDEQDTAAVPDSRVGSGSERADSPDLAVAGIFSSQVPASDPAPVAAAAAPQQAQPPGRKRGLLGLLPPLLPAQPASAAAVQASAETAFPGFAVDRPARKQRQ